MQNWKDFFTITYHPSPGAYIVHWQDTSKPTGYESFWFKEGAEAWIKENAQRLIDKKFEEIFIE